jgi:Myb-like DNA-binding domain
MLIDTEIENSRPLLWRELAKQIPGRSNKDCRKRWWNSLANSTAKGPWSEAEDKRLIKAVWEHGTNWNEVARIVATRYADQCSSHWSQVLDPDINHCDWTAQEVR